MLAACAKEPSAPLGTTEVASGTSGTITVSLPEAVTKTVLGGKAAGKYPTIWQEGDCLQLNGYSSLPLSAEAAGGASAGFVFRDGLAAPFNLLYPVSGEKDLVVFPATQSYVKDSFDPAATPMWGASESYTDVTLKHLSSLVRISIKTEKERVLKGITLTALGGESISGSFRAGVDEKGAFNGSLIPENGTADVFYSFGEEGLHLGAGETVVAYISIPVGSYSQGFKAVVKSAAYEYRQLNFFGAGRSITPGKVLEFPDKTFEDCFAVWEYYVSATGTGDGFSEEAPMSIEKMLALLQDGESDRIDEATFHFTAGTHTITSPIVLPGLDIYTNPVTYTITGDNQAILNGGGTSQIFQVLADNGHVTVKDLTLTNGSAASGGLALIQHTGPLFKNCLFTGTTSTGAGGAVRIDTAEKGNGRFEGCAFTGNTGANGGAAVITNANTTASFTDCLFSGNTTAGGGGAFYSTNGVVTMDNCTIEGNTANNGGAFYASGGTIKINGGIISNNTATLEGGAIYASDRQKPVYYINGCCLADNTASKNGYVIYLNTSNASGFATLCVNNSTIYNSAAMTGSNASAVCNKGKTLLLNSTLYGTTSSWGTFALGCHKNFNDEYGCLLLNCIFVNTAAGKPAIYETGTNYYAIAQNCIASVVSDNTQFTRTNVISAVPSLHWDKGVFTWNGETDLPHMSSADIESVLSNGNYQMAPAFLAWLKSLKYNIDGAEYNALDVDQQGHLRNTYSWPGAYQK